ncbi:MAG: tetratricopeptide repeat protein [Oscillospiraceae bacterium]|nr:tetratricopeptide repeat protein [Oscillospiraceae bacterium]
MLRCDFSSVIGIIREYISEGNATTQPELIGDLFCTFLEKNEDFDFDNGQINRWIKGLAAVSPKIAEFYQHKSAAESLAADIETLIFPILHDTAMAAENIHTLVMNDISVSEQKRNELTAEYPEDIAAFMATVIIFAISRKFEKRDIKALALGTLSPVVSDMIFDGEVPKPCKHFCGRDTELESLHELLNTHNKVFIHGIAGIGKSEFAKAYANAHKKDYTNILYFQYNSSLQKMIAGMDFADDNSGDDETERFRKHNRFLRSLKDDTLIIVDNFNTTASKETKLDILMKYNCRVIFTTRSSFEVGTAFELTEISDIDTLLSLARKFYSDLDSNRETVVKIIEAVHRHTLAVEMSARLLQKGMLEPDELLSALLNSSANPDSPDKIGINKDGINTKATYYNHIRTLFSLYLLDEDKQSIMRCMVFVPQTGIRARMFAKWLGLNAMDDINELVELGFITNSEMDKISLLPMVRDIATTDLSASVTSCITLLNSIQQICLRHGEDVPYRKTLFEIVESVIRYAEKDNLSLYIRFIEDAFSYMEKYKYESGMRLIVSEMDMYKNKLSPNDFALLYDCKSTVEAMLNNNVTKAIALSEKAVQTCIPEANLHLAANLNMNLGYYYHLNKNTVKAKEYMEKGLAYMWEHNEPNNDVVIMLHNYANLMSDLGEPIKAVRAMKKCAEMIKAAHTEVCVDYADLYLDIGIIYLQMQNTASAFSSFEEACRVYKAVLSENEIQQKCGVVLDFCKSMNISSTPDFLTFTRNTE